MRGLPSCQILRWIRRGLGLFLNFFKPFGGFYEVFGRGNLYPFIRKDRFETDTELFCTGEHRLRQAIFKAARLFRHQRTGEESGVEEKHICARQSWSGAAITFRSEERRVG